MGDILRGEGEWEMVPVAVRRAFGYVLSSLEELKQQIETKAEVPDVFHSLQAKADTAVVRDMTVSLGERVAYVTNRLNSMEEGLRAYNTPNPLGKKVAQIEENMKFISAEILKDRDDWADVNIRLDSIATYIESEKQDGQRHIKQPPQSQLPQQPPPPLPSCMSGEPSDVVLNLSEETLSFVDRRLE
eukprot:TRINITY_DN14498_c2_g1_i1.p1 TRINITY_DN14498_c2_g1~~TRINITY_DN14498_c2_g1_i1.p1  ORF type:complete len:200 (+),score=47.85 TRINITY_DN14498_c2_g1_i1:40-600(+)